MHRPGIEGFADKLSLACDNLPPHASCTFDQTSVQLLPNGAATVKLIVDTDDVLGFKSELAPRPGTIAFALFLTPACLFPLAALSRRRTLTRLFILFGALAVTISITGCDGLYPKSTAPGTYTINVTATGASSQLTHAATVTLTVTQ